MSVRSLNKVMLIGNLTRDPNLRFTPNNTAVCSFGLATNRTWTPSDGGERQEKTEFHNVVSWSKLAEICGQILHKGDKVYVEGRLQTRDWKTTEGTERRITEIIIDNMMLLRSKGSYSSYSNNGNYSRDDRGQAQTDDTVSDDAKTDDATDAVEEKEEKPKKKTAKKETPKKEVVEETTDAEDVSDDIPF